MAETIIGLYKTEVINRQGPWRGLDDVEYATLEWIDWFNHRRILEPIGDIPPAEYEDNYYRQNSPAETAGPKQNSGKTTVSDKPGPVHWTGSRTGQRIFIEFSPRTLHMLDNHALGAAKREFIVEPVRSFGIVGREDNLSGSHRDGQPLI